MLFRNNAKNYSKPQYNLLTMQNLKKNYNLAKRKLMAAT